MALRLGRTAAEAENDGLLLGSPPRRYRPLIRCFGCSAERSSVFTSSMILA